MSKIITNNQDKSFTGVHKANILLGVKGHSEEMGFKISKTDKEAAFLTCSGRQVS